MEQRKKMPQQPVNQKFQFPQPFVSLSFDMGAFNNAIMSQGVYFRHIRGMPDPRGLRQMGDNRRDPDASSSDGLIYKPYKCFIGLFQVNGKEVDFNIAGEVDMSAATITPTQFYKDSDEPIAINVFDRLEIENIELRVVTSQLVEANFTGKDRLNFPALCVEYLVGSDGYEYTEGNNFQVNLNGDIEWLTQKRPSVDPATGKGEVYSIRYRYKPYFVVTRLMHEIRVAQTQNRQSGDRYLERAPYQIQVTRENVFRDRSRTSDLQPKDPRLAGDTTSGNEW